MLMFSVSCRVLPSDGKLTIRAPQTTIAKKRRRLKVLRMSQLQLGSRVFSSAFSEY
jgi:hypothetical protein